MFFIMGQYIVTFVHKMLIIISKAASTEPSMVSETSITAPIMSYSVTVIIYWLGQVCHIRDMLQEQNPLGRSTTGMFSVAHTYAEFWCALFSCGYIMRSLWIHESNLWIHSAYLSIFFRVSSLALGQSYDCPSASEATLKDMGIG